MDTGRKDGDIHPGCASLSSYGLAPRERFVQIGDPNTATATNIVETLTVEVQIFIWFVPVYAILLVALVVVFFFCCVAPFMVVDPQFRISFPSANPSNRRFIHYSFILHPHHPP